MSPEYWKKKAELAERHAVFYKEQAEFLGDSLVEIEQTLLDEIVRLREELGMPQKNPWELP